MLLSLVTFIALARVQTSAPTLTVTPQNPTCIYQAGEKVGWNLSLPADTKVPELKFTVKANNAVQLAQGPVKFDHGVAKIETSVAEPAMIWLEITGPGRKPATYGAAYQPTKIAPVVPRPNDFDSFWQRKIKELEAVPMNPKVTPIDIGRTDIEYGILQMDHVNGTQAHGQWAKPKRAGKFPAMLILQWASPPYPLDRSWATNPARDGWLTLNIEPHNTLSNAPAEYYRNLPAELRNYQKIGWEDREKSYFVEMYLRGYRAVEYLSKCPDWDGKTIVVTGGSMGGQQSLAVAGLNRKVTHVIVNEPAGCDLNAPLHGRQVGYPFFPADNTKVMETARYVDVVNFARNIRAHCLVAMGFIDNVAQPTGIWTAFNQIRGPKEAAPMTEAPHNNTATWEQQRPYNDRAAEWLKALVQGKPIPPRSK